MFESNKNLRWAYMDHWRIDTPQGALSQYSSVERFDGFLKQIAALGFEAIETFDFHLHSMRDLVGSLDNCRNFLQERGVDRVLSLFHAVMFDRQRSAPHLRSSHDSIVGNAERVVSSCEAGCAKSDRDARQPIP